MLKIKNNVELKELEKFGFEYDENYEAYIRFSNLGISNIKTYVFLRNPNYKKNQLVCESSVWFDTIFKDDRIALLNQDLIKAEIVEKVED
jgi:hypothetical protein